MSKRSKPSRTTASGGSVARQLVELVWNEAPVRSWQRLNHTMQYALATAIKGGLRFEPDDIQHFWDTMRGGFWFTGADSEWMHRLACVWDNVPAAVSYEKWVGRGPFILEGKRLYVGRSIDLLYLSLPPVTDDRPRCAVVTSFAKDGESVNICVYDDHAPTDERRSMGVVMPSGKPKVRIKMNLEAIRGIERVRKLATKTPAVGMSVAP